jgi:hypothetical protein
LSRGCPRRVQFSPCLPFELPPSGFFGGHCQISCQTGSPESPSLQFSSCTKTATFPAGLVSRPLQSRPRFSRRHHASPSHPCESRATARIPSPSRFVVLTCRRIPRREGACMAVRERSSECLCSHLHRNILLSGPTTRMVDPPHGLQLTKKGCRLITTHLVLTIGSVGAFFYRPRKQLDLGRSSSLVGRQGFGPVKLSHGGGRGFKSLPAHFFHEWEPLESLT